MEDYDKLCARLHKELREIEDKDKFCRCDLSDALALIEGINGLAAMSAVPETHHTVTITAHHAEHAEHPMHLSIEDAKKWTSKMQNADGTTGPHWTLDQTSSVMAQRGITCDKADFYAAINMMYSDYCMVAKAYSADNPNFYADMAAAFLRDKDAVPGKIVEYLDVIVDG